MTTTERDAEVALQGMLEEADLFRYDNNDDAVQVQAVRPFHECGLLTTNKGLVLKLSDGTEFQLQIVQSK